jgi:LacI family transcriptional regulator
VRRRGRADGNVRITIAEVAALAAVSTATASRALNRPGAVSASLRDRVAAAVARLGYVPNQTARALSSLHSGLVGFLIPAVDAGYAELLEVMVARLRAAGYATLVAAPGGDGDPGGGGARAMAAREVEGLVVVGTEPGATMGALLNERRIPYVLVDAGGHTSLALRVDVSYAVAGENAARYLVGLGHRSLAFLSSPTTSPWRRDALLQGLRAGLAASDLTLPSERIRACAAPEIRTALRLWFTGAAPPSALVCADDLLALVTLREGALLGIAVPGQLSIIGCGDLPFARYASPALSTLRIPSVTVGNAAVDQLLARLAGGSPFGQLIPVKLVIRRSTGPAPI